MYNFTLKAPAPILTDEIVCYENTATLEATGAKSYKWYTAKTGGEPFFEGEIYMTGILRQDTTFFVSNADNSWESVRTPVNVFLRANPMISLSGSRSLCDNDTLILVAENADSYLWDPGNETTQSIRISEAGTYSVTVMDTTYGCVSTSEEIFVQKLESPKANFEVEPQEIEKSLETGISVTDLSVNAMNWFWQLSDGHSSNDQNPSFTVNSMVPIKVYLIITADNGCQDTTSVIIDVITSLEEAPPPDSWILFPNPSQGMMQFRLINDIEGLYQVSIVSLEGKVIRSYTFSKTGPIEENMIDLSGLSGGVYVISLQDPGGNKAFRRIMIK
jgi:PKD repeat protein